MYLFNNVKISDKDLHFFSKAVDLAQHGEHRVRVGALGVVNGTPMGGAFNVIRNTSPVPFTDITTHAEECVINLIPSSNISRTTLYVARVSRGNLVMDSRPCERCLQLINAHGLKAISYWSEGTLLKFRLNKGDTWTQ